MASEVYIANLPDDVTEQIFRNKLKIFGDVSSVVVKKPQGLYQGKPGKTYGLVTYFEKEAAEKCVNGKIFLDNMFGTSVFIKWSHHSPHKSSSGSCTSTSNSSSYGPKSSASSTHKNERKKCQDPTCNQLLNYSPPQGKNFCPKCGLDQNFNAGEVQRPQKYDTAIGAVHNSNQNVAGATAVSDFMGIDREFSSILKLKETVEVLKQQRGSDDSNNNVDFTNLPRVLMKVQDFLHHDETKFDQLIQSINRSEEFYYTCAEMVDNAEESVLPLLQQSLDGASQAFYRKLVEYLEKCQYNELDSLVYEIMQEKYKLMPPTHKSLDDGLSTSREILREIERIQEQNDFPTDGNNPPTAINSRSCDPETNPDELMETLSNRLSQIASVLTMKESPSDQENLPKIEPLLKEIKETLEYKHNELEEEILYKSNTLSVEDQGRIFIIFRIVKEIIESQMIKFKTYYQNIQELCQSHNFTFKFETSKLPVFLKLKEELPAYLLENTKPKDEKVEFNDRLSDVIFPGDDDLY